MIKSQCVAIMTGDSTASKAIPRAIPLVWQLCFVYWQQLESQGTQITPVCPCRSTTDVSGFRRWKSKAEDAIDAISHWLTGSVAEDLKENNVRAGVSAKPQMD
jgi:hypothetical protein